MRNEPKADRAAAPPQPPTGPGDAGPQAKCASQFNLDEHQRLHRLFQQFQSLKSTNPSGAKAAFEQFKAGLERHIRQEELILFPCFEYKCAGAKFSPVDVLKREHGQLLIYLDDITGKLARDDFNTTDDEMRVESALDRHSQNEEEALFPALDKVLSDQERAAVFAALDRCR